MSREISRNAGNVYDKFDNKDWMVTPKFSDGQQTSYVNVSNVSVYDDKSVSEFEDMNITDMLGMAVKIIK